MYAANDLAPESTIKSLLTQEVQRMSHRYWIVTEMIEHACVFVDICRVKLDYVWANPENVRVAKLVLTYNHSGVLSQCGPIIHDIP